MQDIPAEYLPPLPSARQRTSVGVRDARVEAMMAAMQQRPASMDRRTSVDSTNRTRGQSVDLSAAPDRPISVRSGMNDRPLSIRSSTSTGSRTDIPVAVVEQTRPSSVTSMPRITSNSFAGQENRLSISSRSGRTAEPEELPIAMAEVESPFEERTTSKSYPGIPPIARGYANEAGNRATLTLSDEELARRLHEQLNGAAAQDGQIVTAQIVQQEMLERREAEAMLDDEIAALEQAVMARQLQTPEAEDDAGAAEDEAWRTALAQNQKLDYMRPESHKPKFSLFIFIVCVIAMCVEIGVNQGIEPFQVNPTLGPKPSILLLLGAKRSDLILQGEYWRLVAPIILHAGILHLLFNMLGLWNIGVPMEREFGTFKIASIFVLSGLFGVLMSCLFAPKLTSVGASGAIFGLFGAAWADLIQNWSLYKGTQIRMLIQLILMTSLNIVLGLMPFLDNYAHVGGMACGCILGLGVLVQTRYYYSGVKKRKRVYQIVLIIISFIALPGMFIAAYTVFFLRVPINCKWCTYISCVPMPPNAPYAERWWSCDECSQGGLQGNIDPANNTLSFICPNSGVEKTKAFPNTTSIDTNLLIETCVSMCLA